MKIFKIAFLALVLAISLCAVSNANAQNLQRGQVSGFVYDSSHALVPGAKVTIANTEFNLPDHSELAATDDMGNYTLNIIKLNRCREFGANSVVKYGSPTEGTASRERPDR